MIFPLVLAAAAGATGTYFSVTTPEQRWLHKTLVEQSFQPKNPPGVFRVQLHALFTKKHIFLSNIVREFHSLLQQQPKKQFRQFDFLQLLPKKRLPSSPFLEGSLIIHSRDEYQTFRNIFHFDQYHHHFSFPCYKKKDFQSISFTPFLISASVDGQDVTKKMFSYAGPKKNFYSDIPDYPRLRVRDVPFLKYKDTLTLIDSFGQHHVTHLQKDSFIRFHRET